MKLRMNNGNINIDGQSFTGNSISINNGKVTVDGVVQDGKLVGEVNITVYGNVIHLENDCGSVTAKNVGSIQTKSGDVNCQDIDGSVQTMSGDVTCGAIRGSVTTTSGDIRHR